MTVQIAYFSGTGCTEHVARTFAGEFEARGHTVISTSLSKGYAFSDAYDLLVVCFVVHACNAPAPVMTWARKLSNGNGRPVAVISVSGGGEVTPNLACREPLKRRLRKSGYRIAYEKMLVMPSNFILETKPLLCGELMRVLPYKVSSIVDDVIGGRKRSSLPLLGNRLLTALCSLEHFGSRFFGKGMRVSEACSACGLCARHCPVGNIALEDGRPVFDDSCVLCLRCVYICPRNALKPTLLRFMVLEKGFDLQALLRQPIRLDHVDLDAEAKGLAWLGIKRYLETTSDMLEPASKKPRAIGQSGQSVQPPQPPR